MSSSPKYRKPKNTDVDPTVLLFGLGLILSVFLPIVIPILVLAFVGVFYYKTRVINSVKKDFGFLGDNEDFIKSILALAAYIAKADKKVSALELTYVEKALKKDFKAKYAEEYFALYKVFLKKKISPGNIAMKINSAFELSGKIQILDFLVGLIATDGKLTPEEEYKIFTIARLLRVRHTFLKGVLASYGFKHTYQQRKKRTYQKNYQRKTFTSNLDTAYAILGISKTATDAQVKKAYRKLAKIHHPDRVIHLGEAYQKKAKEKFQKISDAYELIKERRGMV